MDGIIIINKEKGVTSHTVVNKIRKILNIKKVGHTGTLDPNATGVLPILIGNGTKLSKYLIEHDKTYKVVLKLGAITDTLDSEGQIIKTEKYTIKDIDNIKTVFNSFIGEISQIPPIYSAIKVNGKKLYEYARENKEVKILPRTVYIHNIKIENINIDNNEILFLVSCSKGTYIRTLCKDLAERLGTIGYTLELNRTRVDKFTIDNAVTTEELEKNINNLDKFVLKIESILNNQKVNLEKEKLDLFINGGRIKTIFEDGIYNIYCENIFIGIGTIKDKLLKRDIVI